MIIYDVEIKRAIPDKNGRFETGVEYCNGWTDYLGMGIAVVCAYDYDSDQYRVFCEDNIRAFDALVKQNRALYIGYNNGSFDNNLLAAHGINIHRAYTYDLLSKIRIALGYSENRAPRGLKLDDVCAANFAELRKTESGALAPIMWQRGQVGRVIDYCMNDVRMTKGLFDLVLKCEPIKTPLGIAKLGNPCTSNSVCFGCGSVTFEE